MTLPGCFARSRMICIFSFRRTDSALSGVGFGLADGLPGAAPAFPLVPVLAVGLGLGLGDGEGVGSCVGLGVGGEVGEGSPFATENRVGTSASIAPTAAVVALPLYCVSQSPAFSSADSRA